MTAGADTELKPEFPSWREASEYGLAVAMQWLQRTPAYWRLSRAEVRAVVQAALWESERKGAVLTRGFVALCAKHKVIDELRHLIPRRGRREWLRAGEPIDDLLEHPELAVAPEQERALEEQERRAQAHRLLEQLDPRRRLVIELAYFREVPLHRVAQGLGVCVARVSQLHSSALATLGGESASERSASGRLEREQLRQQAAALRARGLSYAEIAARMGMSWQQGYSLLNTPKRPVKVRAA